HGSRDPRYLESVRKFAEALGLGYAFLEGFTPIRGAVYVPVFIAGGSDYRRALRLSGSSIPPLARWPGFKEYLKGLGAAVYIFHGSREEEYIEDVRSLGLPYVFLEGEPPVGPDACKGVGAPVVLTRGVIYDRMASAWRDAGCREELLPPLFEQKDFARYFSEALRSLVAPTGGGDF
ncbi:MAG: transposase, partial [Thermoproteus sp.]